MEAHFLCFKRQVAGWSEGLFERDSLRREMEVHFVETFLKRMFLFALYGNLGFFHLGRNAKLFKIVAS